MMKVIEVLHMNGGTGDASYANNSLVQEKVISMTRPIVQEAVTEFFDTTAFPESICIADLGCSSGPNTLLAVQGIIKATETIVKQQGLESPEFQVYFNDLPGNDFNSLFRALPQFQDRLKHEMASGFGPCFFTGVPGSFYQRLFLSNTLHFVHSSYSLQWLSQVPKLEETNKGNIYMASTSPPSVLKAYHEQFQRDFSAFLECRSQELVIGGRMILTFLGRKSDDPSSKECCYIWELLSMALNDMVLQHLIRNLTIPKLQEFPKTEILVAPDKYWWMQGLIEENKVDEFNIPQYTPSPNEVENEVEKEGSFSIDHLEITAVNWNVEAVKDGGYNVAKLMRAVAEPLLVNQFGEDIIDKVFQRYQEILADTISKEKTQFFNVIVSMTKKAV